MTDLAIARLLHVGAVVVWIGGVAMVTMVVLPVARAGKHPGLFEEVERRFAPVARWCVGVAGLSGLYMVERSGLWPRFLEARFWWMHAMVLVWVAFVVALFILEPLAGHRRPALERIARLHWLALAVSLVAVAGAAAGSHGLF